MSLPILNAVDPTVIPAKTYDRIWIEEIVIRAPDPNGDVNGEVKLSKYGIFNDVAELDPSGGTWIRIQNMLSLSESDPNLQNAVSALISYIAAMGVREGIISI